MSEAIKRLEEIAGVPLGGFKEPVKPFLDALAEKGQLQPHKHWVTQARRKESDGRSLLIQADVNIADRNNTSKKDTLYRDIATEGVASRRYATEPGFTHRFAKNGLVEAVGANLGLRGTDIRFFLRAMRADLCFGQNREDREGSDNKLFIEIANEYLRASTEALRPSKRYPTLVRINKEWDRKSAVTFYEAMYAEPNGGTSRLGGWVPYEFAVMQRFYEMRTQQAVTAPTPFDEQVFKSLKNSDYLILVKEVRRAAGVLIDAEVVLKHRNALVYGRPSSGLF